ncbi:DNA polymerase III subunit gamma/tau [uncultured Eubacterium sp.]|uniref:DNA polymerase III subunit gamma/tau n=1 Tax=Eubacterium sp. TaxID=142586 RepID=UPI003266C1BE
MLYNDERPQNFNDLLGQDANKEVFKRQITTGKFSHAYLFYGHHGCGKTTSARALARAAVCQHPTENGPCGECAMCKAMEKSIDYVEIDAASNTGVDAIRDKVIEAVKYQPIDLPKKIIIIDEVHMLSQSAFNALLKTIEEPPKNVIIFLCTTEIDKVPKTIVSRCQKFVFDGLSVNDIMTGLLKTSKTHNINIDEDALKVIAMAANGAMRDALSILDQVKDEEHVTKEQIVELVGMGNTIIVKDILNSVKEGNVKSVSDLVDKFLGTSSILTLIDSLMEEILERAVGGENEFLGMMKELSSVRKESTAIRVKSILISDTYKESEIEHLKKRVKELEDIVKNGYEVKGEKVTENDTLDDVNLSVGEDENLEPTFEEVSNEDVPDEIREQELSKPDEINLINNEPSEQKVNVKTQVEQLPNDNLFHNPFSW